MNRFQKLLAASCLILLVVAGSVVMANAQNQRRLQQARPGAARFGGMFRPGMFVAGLDLTDQQKEQVKAILANHKDDIKAAVQGDVQARKAVREALMGGADEAALKAAYDQASAAGWQTLLLRSKINAEIKPILTPEQQAKLQQRLQNLKKIGVKRLAARTAKRLSL